MDCQEARDVIHAYFDGELDLVRTLDFERHIHDCQSCSRAHKGLAAMRSSIRGAGLYYKAPLGLEQRIRADVRKARGETGREAGGRPVSITWRWMAMAASLAFIAFALWTLVRTPGVSQEKLLAQEVRASHVRSLMGTHLMDVESADQHTVKPWFDGKLDFAPDVRDFKAESFPLIGGRLDYLADRAVAALVYRHEKHFINLFIWPAPNEADRSVTESVEKGYSVIHWIRAGINYWVISDTSDQTLRRFADLYRDKGAAATMP
jgi:anti-sigma factor RsiW